MKLYSLLLSYSRNCRTENMKDIPKVLARIYHIPCSTHRYIRMSSPKQQDTVSSVTEGTAPESWSKVSCRCCVSSEVEPLVLIQLAENVEPSTKQWIMAMISAPIKAGGEGRLQINPCKVELGIQHSAAPII